MNATTPLTGQWGEIPFDGVGEVRDLLKRYIPVLLYYYSALRRKPLQATASHCKKDSELFYQAF